MGMVIDVDVNVPKRLTGDLQTTQQEILQKIQEVLSYGKTRLLVIRLTYERSLPTGNLLVLIQTHPVRDQGQAPHEMMGRTETLVLPQLLVEEGSPVTRKEPCQLIGYYERQQNTDAGERQAYLITQEASGKANGTAFCSLWHHTSICRGAELQKKREVCLMLSMRSMRAVSGILFPSAGACASDRLLPAGTQIEERTNQTRFMFLLAVWNWQMPLSVLCLKRGSPLTLDASVGRLIAAMMRSTIRSFLKDYAFGEN